MRRAAVGLTLLLVLVGCGHAHGGSSAGSAPAFVEVVPRTGQRRLHLTPDAVKRLDIHTVAVREQVVPGRGVALGAPVARLTAVRTDTADTTPTYRGGPSAPPPIAPATTTTTAPPAPRQVIPYSAVLYQPSGDAFTYANAAPNVFVRLPLNVDYVTGDLAVLVNGPPDGTLVVSVGGTELLGIDEGVGG